MIKTFLNPEGHQNHIFGSKVTILLKVWILPIGGTSAVEGLRSTGLPRLVFTKTDIILCLWLNCSFKCLEKGWTLTFFIIGFGLSKKLSIKIGLVFSYKGLKSQDLRSTAHDWSWQFMAVYDCSWQFKRVNDLVALGLQLVSLFKLGSMRITRVHLFPPVLGSFWFTCIHLRSLGITLVYFGCHPPHAKASQHETWKYEEITRIVFLKCLFQWT